MNYGYMSSKPAAFPDFMQLIAVVISMSVKSLAYIDFGSQLRFLSLSSVLTFVLYLLSNFALESSIIRLANAFGLISVVCFFRLLLGSIFLSKFYAFLLECLKSISSTVLIHRGFRAIESEFKNASAVSGLLLIWYSLYRSSLSLL